MTTMYPPKPGERPYPGQPVAGRNPAHQPRIPMAAGVPPFCSCGYVGGNGHDRPLLATHIADNER